MHVCSVSHVWLFGTPWTTHQVPSSSVHGTLQARILEWVSSGDPGDLLNPGIKPTSPAFPSRVDRFLSTEPSEKILWRRKWQPTPIFLPGEAPGQRRLVGYSSWGLKESDMTEGLHSQKKCPETEYFLILLCERETGVTSLEGQRECKALGKRFLLPAK